MRRGRLRLKRPHEGGPAAGEGREFGGVRDMSPGRVTGAALRPSRPWSCSVAARPASSASKARKTRPQPRRDAAMRSAPCVPSAAQAGRPPPGERDPVEDALGEHHERGGGAEPCGDRAPAWFRAVLGTWCEAAGVDGPSGHPARDPAGYVCPTTIMPARRSPRAVNRPERLRRSAPKPAASMMASAGPIPGA